MEKDTVGDEMNTRKRARKQDAPHQRLWWMELARGLITCAFSLLFLASRPFAPRLFIYSLGVYLVVDGLLELSDDVRRSKSVSRLKALDFAGEALSLCAGLLSIVFPSVALFFFAGIIALRLVIRGISETRTARRARGSTAFLLWVYSSFLALLGLLLLLFPLPAITLLVVFLGSYMLVAGLVLVWRGLSLRFRAGSLPVSPSRPSLALPRLSDELPSSTRRAVVFVRRDAAEGLGHIAWGFEWLNGWFNVGSVENLKGKPFADPAGMDFWSTHTLDPMTTIQEREFPYDEYKLFFVARPHPKDAWKTVIWESHEPYSFVHHNCCDVTYEVLRTYGCMDLLDPAKEYIPNDWFDALPGASYGIATYPAIQISSHRQWRREVTTREIALAIPPRMQGVPPPWLDRRWRAWEELALVWEMMIGHILTLWAAGIKLIAHQRHRSAPRL